jgi:ABC-type sugar transport system substrate-binding protein
MSRRLSLFAIAAAVSVHVYPTGAQQPTRIPVVAVLMTHAAVSDPWLDELRTGLRAYGYEDGRNLRFEPVTVGGQLDQLPTVAGELVRQGVDVIICPQIPSC